MILGCLSSMQIEEEDFLKTIRRGEKEEIRSLISGYLKRLFKVIMHKNRKCRIGIGGSDTVFLFKNVISQWCQMPFCFH